MALRNAKKAGKRVMLVKPVLVVLLCSVVGPAFGVGLFLLIHQ